MTETDRRNHFDHTRQRRFVAAAIALFLAGGPLLQPGSAQQPGGVNDPDQAAGSTTSPAPATAGNAPADLTDPRTPPGKVIEKIAASGRVLMIGETSSSRLNPIVRLAPGAPPILAFRYLDGQARHRFGDLDLVMDDAGH